MIGNWIMGVGISMLLICSAIDGYQDSQFRKACAGKNGITVHSTDGLQCMKKDNTIKIE